MKKIIIIILILVPFWMNAQFDGQDTLHTTNLSVNGNITSTGDISYRLRHLHAYFSDSSITINITQNTFTHITNAFYNLFITGEASYVTFIGDSITVQTPGDYFLDFRFDGSSATSNDDFEFKLYKNNSPVLGSFDSQTTGAITTLNGGWIWYLHDLVEGDDLKIMVTNKNDNDDLVLEDAVIYFKKEHN